MSAKNAEPAELCLGCVYFPPNLPRQAYAQRDWDILQARSCSFEHLPGTADCLENRKTSCSLVDLDQTG
ncbi:MAG: hypothetical protein Q8J72_00505 [Rhodocyclaceae bacterium]|nr:hypothetical protein [Rhodocyclaceae bacterium]